MRTLYVALGSNLGRRVEMLNAARRMLAEQAGPEIACSSYYETAPEGFASAHPFLNAAAAYRTALPPGQLLECTQHIERSLGRTKKSEGLDYADRSIDIDLLLLDDVCLTAPDGGLILPHPRLHRRRFVMEPLREIAPQLMHPRFGLSVTQLYDRLTDRGEPRIVRLEHASAVEAADLSALCEQLQHRPCPDCSARLAALLAAPGSYLYALRRPGGALVGTATLSLTPLLTGRKAWIDDVVIDTALRGQGWGRRLMQHIMAEAKQLGADALQLTSRPTREAAHALYRSLGFNQRDTHVFRMSCGQP